jgi:phytoene dehydrogenase-like protein
VKYDVIVIGAGINGLTAAAYLAKAGQRVLVLERREAIGGLAGTDEIAPGFRADALAGETGFVPPTLVRDLELGQTLQWIETDATVHVPRANGGWLTLWRDMARSVDALRVHSPADAAKWPAFCERMSRFAGFLEHVYASPPPRPHGTKPAELLSLFSLGKRMRGLGKTEMIELLRTLPMAVAELLDEWFEDDALKAAVGTAGVRNIFQGPRSGGTLFILLHHHIGERPGVFTGKRRLRGGAAALADALASAARRYGAELRTDADVERVDIRDGRAVGVVLADGEEIEAANVAASADPRRTFLRLVDPIELSPEFVRAVRNIKFRGATAFVDLALDQPPHFTGLDAGAGTPAGVVTLVPSLTALERAYDDAKHGRVSQRPLLEVSIPSASDPTMCPAGKHVMSVRVQYAPYRLRDGCWDDTRREALGDAVIRTLEEYAPNVPRSILHRRVRTPADLEEQYGLTEGHLGHGELTLDQILFMRPVPGWAHYRTPIERLYLCGSGAHPGGGIAGGAGKLAASVIEKDGKR